ncbi:unnamed protein product [Prunus armeniaca]|uniref:Uncharacterized protein n=1 Tax=Prunus armeniaca TaxID=36596 RepID=A0A6J5W2N5_PRUAR|nr:hypothetical protein GBA52_002538 [Prunus armeniaca]CAB4265092.1 unnamed protein product [Prunus armeniaca]CAB4295686.1 unnamed protein product [Prunus armeniaca]
MEIAPVAYYDNLKRYWRRRRYQRLNGDTKKKMRVTRLGGVKTTRRIWKLRSAMPKLRLMKFVSPLKLLTKFHDAYVDMMYRMAGNAASVGRISGKKVAKAQDQISIASCGEEVDGRLVLEIYKRLAASRQLLIDY